MMTDNPKRPTRRAAVIMLTIVAIVIIAFIGMNLHDVTKAVH